MIDEVIQIAAKKLVELGVRTFRHDNYVVDVGPVESEGLPPALQVAWRWQSLRSFGSSSGGWTLKLETLLTTFQVGGGLGVAELLPPEFPQDLSRLIVDYLVFKGVIMKVEDARVATEDVPAVSLKEVSVPQKENPMSDKNEAREQGYIEGQRAAWVGILRTAIHEVGLPGATLERLQLERAETIVRLRALFAALGFDAAWTDENYLPDVIDRLRKELL